MVDIRPRSALPSVRKVEGTVTTSMDGFQFWGVIGRGKAKGDLNVVGFESAKKNKKVKKELAY